jgi:hypothetical protein
MLWGVAVMVKQSGTPMHAQACSLSCWLADVPVWIYEALSKSVSKGASWFVLGAVRTNA